MTFPRLFQPAAGAADSNPSDTVDRLFFTKADPQPFRHPLLAHLQHSLYTHLDGGGHHGTINGKHGQIGHEYFYPTPHRHSFSWVDHKPKHHHYHKSNSTALSALTLLAFLFFLNLLQNCLREQMETMNPTVMVMTAGGARGERLDKSAEQLVDSRDVYSDDVEEEEVVFPEERVQTKAMNVSKSAASFVKGGNYYHNYLPKRNAMGGEVGKEEEMFTDYSHSAATTERPRFQRISLASYSSHEATSPNNVVFRTRL